MTDNPLKIINHSITRLLAMREHSFKELTEKLVCRDFDSTLVVQQLNEFKQQNLQSDLRFAELCIRSKANKGQGEQRIRAALQEHSVDEATIAMAFAQAEIDFEQVARSVYAKKYQGKPAANWQEKQKRTRFLRYRGFATEQIRDLLKL